MRPLWLFLLLVFFGGQTQAASFDCAKTQTKVEKLICADNDTSILDSDLAGYYSRILAARPADAAVLKKQQRSWIRTVRNKCATAKCLKDAYEKRIGELLSLGVIEDEGDGEETAEDECEKLGYPLGGSACMGLIRFRDSKFTGGKLDQTYQSLLSALSTDTNGKFFAFSREEIVVLQASWEQYRDAYCALYGGILGGPSSGASAHTSECISDLNDKQNGFLEKLLTCVKNRGGCEFEYN